MGMVVMAALWTVWTLGAVGAAWALWRSMTSHRKVYMLIVVHGLYTAGVFVIYALGCRAGAP